MVARWPAHDELFSSCTPQQRRLRLHLHTGAWMLCFCQMNQVVENVNYLSRHFRKALEGKKSITKTRSKKGMLPLFPVRFAQGPSSIIRSDSESPPLPRKSLLTGSLLSLSPWPTVYSIPNLSDLRSHFLTSHLGRNTWHHIWLYHCFGLVGFCLFRQNVVHLP